MIAELAVLITFVAFVLAFVLQLWTGRYVTWFYWLAVSMVGILGTMAADVVHAAPVLSAVFFVWSLTDRTLSVHSIDPPRREAFYRAIFAMS